MNKLYIYLFQNFSIPQLDPVTNEIIETNEQVVINHRQADHHPVIIYRVANKFSDTFQS